MFMEKKLLSICLLLILGLSQVLNAQASVLSDWIGADVVSFSADFDRYDFDTATGKMQGPIKGHFELQRPGYLTLTMADQWIKIADDYLEYAACAKCKVLSMPAAGAVSEPVLLLLDQSVDPEGFFYKKSQTKTAEGGLSETYSLATAGFGQKEMTLSSYEGRPTVLGLNLNAGIKTILQLHGLQSKSLNSQGKQQ